MLAIIQQTGDDLIGLTPQDNISSLERTVGGIDELKYTIYPQSEAFGRATERLTEVAAIDKQFDEEVFRGRVLRVEGKSSKSGTSQTITCESALARLKDGVFNGTVTRTELLSSALMRILQAHRAITDEPSHVYLGDCPMTIVELTKSFDYVTTLTAVTEVISDAGLEYRIRYDDSNDRYLLDVAEMFGGVAAEPIVIGENLGSIRYSTDPSAVGTRIVPLGGIGYNGERLTIRTAHGRNSIYIDRADLIEEYGVKVRVVIHDDIAVEDPAAFGSKVEELYDVGLEDASAQSGKAVTWDITALDLSRAGYDVDTFRIGWWYHIMHPALGVDTTLRLLTMEIDYRAPQASKLTFGTIAATLTGSFASSSQTLQARQTAQIINVTQIIQTATGGITLAKLTEEAYGEMSEHDSNTLYLATTDEDFMAYLGDLPLRAGGAKAGYETLEYIKSTGIQYILTDIIPTYSMTLVADAKFDGTATASDNSDPFGIRSSTEAMAVSFDWGNLAQDGVGYFIGYSNPTGYMHNWYIYNVGHETRQIIKLTRWGDTSGYSYYGNQNCRPYEISVALAEPVSPLVIFGRYDLDNGGAIPFGTYNMYLYGFKIYDENNYLIHDLVPVERRSDGELGLLDTITDKFYSNAGTGTFGKGAYAE